MDQSCNRAQTGLPLQLSWQGEPFKEMTNAVKAAEDRMRAIEARARELLAGSTAAKKPKVWSFAEFKKYEKTIIREN
jgi:hypothetical protein